MGSQPYATHNKWNWRTRPLKRHLRKHHKQFSVAILVFCEVPENLKIIFLRTTNKRRVSYILTSSQYSTHSDTNELWLPLRQLLERIKVVRRVYLYGFVTLLKNWNPKREECEKLFKTNNLMFLKCWYHCRHVTKMKQEMEVLKSSEKA